MPARPRRKNSRRRNASARNRHSRKEERMTDTGQPAGNLVSFTIDPATGRVVKVESLDTNGGRYEMSEEQKASLARGGIDRLEEAVEEAFAAGIDCVLGAEQEEDA